MIFEVSFSSDILLFEWRQYCVHKDDFPWADLWLNLTLVYIEHLGN